MAATETEPSLLVPVTRQPARVRNLVMALAALVVSILFVALVVIVLVVLAWIVLAAVNALPEPERLWPRLVTVALVVIPIVALALAFIINNGAQGRTFYQQQQANRRVSALLLVTMAGLVIVLGEVIAATLTFDAYGALFGAGIAGVVGLGAAGFAHFSGPGTVLSSAHAQRLDPDQATDQQRELLNVVSEISIAANMAPPAVYLIHDGTLNAFAVGTKPDNAAVAVTTGLLDQMDREQLQGVIGHELSHIHNLDARYGVYVAILVGLVGLVTDGFLRMVVRAWADGAFLRGASDADDAKGAAAGLAAGLVIGILLLGLALVLRIFAPIASLLVQAAVSRQREYLADATSVELTRNPVGLARALAALRSDHDPLDFANRGSQHLWFTNPIESGHAVSDSGAGWLATHPSLNARIERLDQLYPQLGAQSD